MTELDKTSKIEIWYWIPYTIGLAILLIVPYRIDVFSGEAQMFFDIMFKITFPITFIIVIFGIVKKYKYDKALIFKRLAVLPWVVVASHMLLLYAGNIFNQEGGHWVLYFLFMISFIISILLYLAGVIIRLVRKRAV